MKKIRIGILGASNIAKKAIIPTLLSLPETFELVGIASRDVSKLTKLTKDLNIKAYEGYETLLNTTIIDAIYIPLPNALHFQFVEKALKNGIHVLVEKSLGCNFQEVSTLVNLAKTKKLALMENFQFRFHSQLTYLIELLKSKELGDIRHLKCYFGFPPFKDLDNIRYQKKLGGGALLDAGAYTTKIAQILLGNKLVVEAAILNSTANKEVDIWGSALLKQPETGIGASLAFGFDNHYQCGIEIWCSKGKISTNRLFTAPYNFEPIYELEKGLEKEIIKLPSDNHFVNMLNYFYTCIHDNTLQKQENDQNLDQARLIETIKNKAL